MKCLLLTLGLALVCGIYAVVIPQTRKDLDILKLAGTWHTMVMVASDLSLLVTENAPLRIYIKEMQPTPEGNMEIVLLKRWVCPQGCGRAARVKDACVELTVIAQKTKGPAVFTVNYQGEGKVTLLDIDYEHYLFFCLKASTHPKERAIVCQYLARTLKANTEVMEKFHRALETLPVPIQISLNFTQGKERCRV
uniref:Lipocalin/cytosolic fatty-acid binding domain-containing protein n=1 Tax=Loxodonta africana TaxID=9785 RepID=G3TUE8_LOXAF